MELGKIEGGFAAMMPRNPIKKMIRECPKCGAIGEDSLRLVYVVSGSFQPDVESDRPSFLIQVFPKSESERFKEISRVASATAVSQVKDNRLCYSGGR